MELRFDFAESDLTTGFRLKYFELYNWGTYDKKIVRLDLDKHNALLTGDIGSGKSTIVDALTTLLVPHQKIVFNKAAGAESKERSLASYILGEYKSQQDESSKNAKAVALRGEESFSVLLARFENEGFDESYTLAQFFHMPKKQVSKFFITSKSELNIKNDFVDTVFEDIRALKKYLRNKPHTNVYDSFSEYSKDFMRSMGIKNDQALNLFYQTVSMKQIGNLTSFVREHMLEKGDVDTKIDELCTNFAELNHTHMLVLRAKEQIEMLMPIDVEGKVYEAHIGQKEIYEEMRNALSTYFAKYEKELVEIKSQELAIEIKKSESSLKSLDEERILKRAREHYLRDELRQNGGELIKTLQAEKVQLEKKCKEKKDKNTLYNQIVKELEMAIVSNEHRFLKNIQEAVQKKEDIEAQSDQVQNNLMHDEVSLRTYKEKKEDLEAEIIYLQNNRSNIPKKVSDIRDEIARSLKIEIESLPFAGELLEVEDKEWQGAIERVLHGFSLSLLVEDQYYDALSDYVNRTHLRGKLVYLKVRTNLKSKEFFETAKNSLLGKIKIKGDSPLYESLKGMLEDRFDIACVKTIEEFRKQKQALTINGQYKSSYERHEKDDRFEINDKRRWSLGWDNLQKLETLKKDQEHLEEKIAFLMKRKQENSQTQKKLQARRDLLNDLLQYKEFEDIDFYSYVKMIDERDKKLEEIQTSSDLLRTLQQNLEQIENELIDLGNRYDATNQKIGSDRTKRDQYDKRLKELDNTLQLEIDQKILENLEKLFIQKISEKLHLGNIVAKERELREEVQKNIDSMGKKINLLVQKLIEKMSLYKNLYKAESKEFDASISSLGEFRAKLFALQRDDLPKFEKRFKELFKEKTIQKTTLIQRELEYQAKEIKGKIEKINNSLKSIEYNSGTYIELIAEPSIEREIREFKQDLKAAVSNAIWDDNSYDEAKFLQIKQIIDRFNGREGYSEIDKKWRALVSDVRNWFNFSAMERYISDGSEKEYYAHSGGKSGGQKEKLAYTVLASSLAFQFGLEYNEVRSRSFRFVMIDEAFNRGSDESTRYALRLFEKLHLQLLVITPKQKINVIEPFVKSVHFVHNQDGMDSSLLSMNIEEYQIQKSS